MTETLAVRVSAGAHGFLALCHVWWATGATWPAPDVRALSHAVLNLEAPFTPQVVLPLAALHLGLAAAVLTARRSGVARLVVRVLVVGLACRAALGVGWAFGIGADPGTAFYWLNLLAYTPACVALAVLDRSLVRTRLVARVRNSLA